MSAAAVFDLTDVMPPRVQIAVTTRERPPRISYPAAEVFRFGMDTFELGLSTIELPPPRRPRAVVWTPAREALWRQSWQRPPVAVWTTEHTATVVLIGLVLPLSPLSAALGFVALPAVFFVAMLALVVVYLALIELAKRWFFAEPAATRPATKPRDQSHRQHRRASRLPGWCSWSPDIAFTSARIEPAVQAEPAATGEGHRWGRPWAAPLVGLWAWRGGPGCPRARPALGARLAVSLTRCPARRGERRPTMASAETTFESRPVVVGVDDSASARDAALWAADLAALWSAPLCLTHVVNRAGTVSPPTAPPWLREMRAAAEQAGAAPTSIDMRYGAPIDQLLARSRAARMLVVGARACRRRATGRWWSVWTRATRGPGHWDRLGAIRGPAGTERWAARGPGD